MYRLKKILTLSIFTIFLIFISGCSNSKNLLLGEWNAEKDIDVKIKKEEYQAGMYLKTVNNVVGFDKEIKAAQEKQIELEQKAAIQEERKKQKRQEKAKKEEEKRRKEQEKNKNQILKM